jgi:hypothetical protein
MKISLYQWNSDDGWEQTKDGGAGFAQLVLFFGASDSLAQAEPYRELRALHPRALIVGCSAGSQIFLAEVEDDSVVAVAISFDQVTVRGVCSDIHSAAASQEIGSNLARQLATPDLGGVLIFSDGLSVNGTQLVEGVISVLGDKIPLSGGLAGDGGRFARTLVGLNETPAEGRIVAIGLYGKGLRMSHAAAGGWDCFGPNRSITQSDGNVLFALDGEPALALYERYLGDEAAGLPGTALLYPLDIWDPLNPDHRIVRTVLAVDKEKQSMTFAGDIPQGWSAQLMRGSHDHLIHGAAQAAQSARDSLQNTDEHESLALLVSCVGRRLLMGSRTSDEVEAVSEVLSRHTTQVGFYSYGEIASHENLGRCSLHNQTMTVTMLAEA